MLKNLLFLLVIVFLNGCSNDSGENPAQQLGNVPKKITETIYAGGITDVSSATFNYEGGKLVDLTGEGFRVQFTYNGEKISKVSYYNGSTLNYENLITYSGDNIVSIVDTLDEEKTDFQYENGNLKYAIYSYKPSVGSDWTEYERIQYFITNSNVITSYHIDHENNPGVTTKRVYSYDAKNHPFKNLNPYIRFLLQFETIHLFNSNNETAIDYFPSISETVASTKRNFEYEFNTNNYPTSIKKYITENSTLISKMDIEY